MKYIMRKFTDMQQTYLKSTINELTSLTNMYSLCNAISLNNMSVIYRHCKATCVLMCKYQMYDCIFKKEIWQ